jgi:hypothetical protein
LNCDHLGSSSGANVCGGLGAGGGLMGGYDHRDLMLYIRWCTPSGKEHVLPLPVGHSERFFSTACACEPLARIDGSTCRNPLYEVQCINVSGTLSVDIEARTNSTAAVAIVSRIGRTARQWLGTQLRPRIDRPSSMFSTETAQGNT